MKKLTKKSFALEFANTLRYEIFKREFIIELKKEKGEEVDVLETNNKIDGELLLQVEKWLENN
jgi:RNase P/RNase MRP subunit p29